LGSVGGTATEATEKVALPATLAKDSGREERADKELALEAYFCILSILNRTGRYDF